MSDEPILELPPLPNTGNADAGPDDDALSPFPDVPVAPKIAFELPPGFDDLDLPPPETTAPKPFEVPSFFAEAAIPEPEEPVFSEETPVQPAEASEALPVTEQSLPVEPEVLQAADEARDVEPEPVAVPETVAAETANVPAIPLPETAEHPVESSAAEVAEPTVFHPDGSLERLVEALERTLPPTSPDPTTGPRRTARGGKRFLRFSLANRGFLIDGDRIREIGLVPAMTFLPRTPDWLRGMTNLRGEMLSVVDLRRYLGFGESVPDPFLNRLVVVSSASGDLQTGLIVDRVDGFARVEEASLLPLPDGRDVPANRYLSGAHFIDDDVAALLDINELLNSETFRGLGFD